MPIFVDPPHVLPLLAALFPLFFVFVDFKSCSKVLVIMPGQTSAGLGCVWREGWRKGVRVGRIGASKNERREREGRRGGGTESGSD